MQDYQCSICKHYFGDLVCEAFPDGIPEEILLGKEHKEKHPEQENEIIFKEED